MAQSHTLFIGLDVHKDALTVADIAQAYGAEVSSLGSLGTRPCDSEQRVRKMPSQAPHLIFVYEAGPCGDWLSRYLRNKGDAGGGVAPSLRPTQPGDRGKTDRRDAVPLARLARSGALTAVYVPPVAEEAMRDLTRAREDARSDGKDATFRLKACLLRHDIRSTGRAHGGPAHLRWLSELVCPSPAQHLVLHADVRAGPEHTARLQRLDQELHEHVTAWRLSPVVDALQALRGGQGTVAVPLGAAMGALTRCASPRALMKYRGLSPSASSSGAQRRQGSMTKAGNTHARRVLVAGAWASRSPATVRRHVPLRLAKQPTGIQDLSWQAQGRLCTRSRRLVSRGTHANVGTVASARARTGFLWALAKAVPIVA